MNDDENNIIQSIELNFISEYNESAFFSDEYTTYLSDVDYYNNNVMINKYTINNTPGLDIFGNISLNTVGEIPRLCGGFKYYISKQSKDKDSYIITKPIEIYFI